MYLGNLLLNPLLLYFEATKKTQESLESLMVNQRGVVSETLYRCLEELSDRLTVFEDTDND